MKRIALAIIMLTACFAQAKNEKNARTVEHKKNKITVKEKDDKGKEKTRAFPLMFDNNRKAVKKAGKK